LHDEAALVSGFPFNEQGSVIEMQPRRLLGEIDVECCPEDLMNDLGAAVFPSTWDSESCERRRAADLSPGGTIDDRDDAKAGPQSAPEATALF